MKYSISRKLLAGAITSTLVLASGHSAAVDLALPSVPLFTAGSAEPNIMLVIDTSGSMKNIVPEAPFVESPNLLATPDLVLAPSYYSASGSAKVASAADACPADNVIPAGRQVLLFMPTATGRPRVVYDNQLFIFGVASGRRCFSPTSDYTAALNPDSAMPCLVGTESFLCPTGNYLRATYTGNYLNWFFNPDSVAGQDWRSGQAFKPVAAGRSAESRINIAKLSATNLVNTIDSRVRLGLSVYDSDDGGKLASAASEIGPLTTVAGADSGKRTSINTAIAGLVAAGATPLAETLSEIGAYFASGNAAGTRLQLHPERTNRNSCGITGTGTADVLSCDQSPSTVFMDTLGGTTAATTPPISLSCQKSFITFLTDGRNTEDLEISTDLRDYDGDCTRGSTRDVGSAICPDIGGTNNEKKLNATPSRSYEAAGVNPSDYMDDVAAALFDIDLRPDGFAGATAEENAFKNNIRTDMIGFADRTVQNDELLKNTAKSGGGLFRAAADAASLATAFKEILDSVLLTQGSASNASTSAGRLDGGSRLYQASFDSGDWSGSFQSFRISQGGTTTCGTNIPAGNICPTPEWDAATRLNAKSASARMIYTYKPSTRAGVTFEWDNLDAFQKEQLRRDPSAPVIIQSETVGMNRLNYLRGDSSNEGNTTDKFRVRTGGKLGDMVNSDPVLVAAPRFNYNFAGYAAFRNAQRNRAPVVYIGGNDGMLHGFRTSDTAASVTPAASGGDEVLAYVPSMAYGTPTAPTLSKLTQNPYTHQFVVDGSPQAGDVQLGSSLSSAGTWASVLVGTMRSGGKGVFGLNVTNPTNFTAGKADDVVMWEFTNADDPALGNTYSQPSIVKMRNGRWAAIFGNGYNSTVPVTDTANFGKAALFIVFIDGPTGTTGANNRWVSTGTNPDYIKLTVDSGVTVAASGVLAAGVPNGLASPIPVDLNGDRVIDFIYAGDLNGNMWRFDVDSPTASNWAVAYNNQPIYTARDAASGGNAQPITGRPEVGLNLLTTDSDDVTVYFGTGKYLESSDNRQSGQPNQSFYAINDVIYTNDAATTKSTSPQAVNRGSLLRQDILREVMTTGGQTFRVTSDNAVNATTPEKGWYIDLFNKNNNAAATGGAGNNRGERSVSAPVLNAGRVLFSTQIPSASECSGGGTGFLMTLDAKNGRRLTTSPLDTNGDGTVNDSDTVSTTLGASTTAANFITSGVQSRVGMIDKPVIFSISNTEDVIFLTGTGNGKKPSESGCKNTLECQNTPTPDRRGRVTWREVIK